jgi:23S rRNA (pseudouridine1915-N3)-methyltransferase
MTCFLSLMNFIGAPASNCIYYLGHRMKIKLIVVGKTEKSYLKEGIAEYAKRLKHYFPFELVETPELKNARKLRTSQIKHAEGELLLKQFVKSDHVVLLDEHGKEFKSREFAAYFQKKANSGLKQLVIVVGGAYGFSEEVYARGDGKVSLSKMTFSHQMVRLFAIEQIYRAMTILKGEPYHHE